MKESVIYSKRPAFVELLSSILPAEQKLAVFSDYQLFFIFARDNKRDLFFADYSSLAGPQLQELKSMFHERKIYYLYSGIEKPGVDDELIKIPFEKQKIKQIADRFFQGQNKISEREEKTLSVLAGKSKHIVHLKNEIINASKNNMSVLLTGETGTGKSLCAMLIHALSDRAKNGGEMITENASALAPALVESELFGVEKGAFTDASSRKGLIGKAHKSSFFLDEIGELSLQLQSKLLLAVQSGIIRSVGCDVSRKVDVRFIFATNSNLEEKIRNREFRQDLFYRISEITINLLPLRERLEDLLEIAEAFLTRLAGDLRLPSALTPVLTQQAKNKLLSYDWPGNIRQLENTLKRAVLNSPGKFIDPDQIVF